MAVTAQQQAAAQPQLVFLDGTFEELALEMAEYLNIASDIQPLVEKNQKEEVLGKLVQASGGLNTVQEKEYTAASNLMIYLVLQSQDPRRYLPTLCNTFAKPITTSPHNGVGLSLNALTTVFNLLPSENPIRARVFLEILKFLKRHAMFDTLRPYLPHLEQWNETWGTDEDFQRSMYEEIAEIASEAGFPEESRRYIIKALRSFDSDDKEELSTEEAQNLALRAIRTALLSNTQYLYQDLRGIPVIEALSDSHPVYYQLLEVFAEQDLEDFNDFNDEHEGWIEEQKLDYDRLYRKMRLLTFASLAAATPSREIPYSNIVRALRIPEEEVEMWTIDAIRAGLVEGKLSQQRKTFLVHKVTYRVFGTKQWQELSTRVDNWKSTLTTVLETLLQGRADVKAQQEREVQELERKLAQANVGGQQGQGGGRRHHQGKQQKERAENAD
ncbi:Eukaryotic translation initiation factor 3 subunit M [Scedosporium apiospermum]|uniref:Eukaryotic translation initiation factor 3 subunit M n=1 Tax=Pseudallescheria apiosperma TaxID=563466 RepID=A0A084GAL6_PSEDA|nr:Eukaryotic translation initiation factor 3 subunit M [Scedosporium apiospermum]KEZ44378.1 Eukaryotic translation initiation factor 3 subunit M [Scedosporium apiospermum]